MRGLFVRSCCYLFISFSVFLTPACGGGGGGGGGSSAPSLMLESTIPEDNADDVALNMPLSANFNQNVSSAGLSGKITLVSDHGDINTAISVSGSTVTIQPSDILSFLTSYTVVIDKSIGAGSSTLGDDVTWSFRTKDRSWSAASEIANSNVYTNSWAPGPGEDPSICFDPNGNAISTWRQYSDTGQNVWAAFYDVDLGWEDAVLIESNPPGNVHRPVIACDDNSNIYVVWSHNGTIYLNQYIANIGWKGEQTLASIAAGSSLPQIAIDNYGKVILTWSNSIGVGITTYSPQTDSDSSEWVVTPAPDSIYRSKLAIDSFNNSLVIWTEDDGSGNDLLWGSRKQNGSGWETPSQLSVDAVSVYEMNLVVNSQGDALVTWGQWNGSNHSSAYNQYTVGVGWGAPQQSPVGNHSDLAIDKSDNVIAVSNGFSGYKFSFDSGWASIGRPEGGFIPYYDDAQVAFDDNGNAIAVAAAFDSGVTSFIAVRYIPSEGWLAPVVIEESELEGNSEMQIAFDSEGRALTVWMQDKGNYIGTASVYSVRSSRLE
ncbi:Ig-like domain-containing protein [Oceanicoccus sp. KOV_DT_Chl]|uniref:Ig-like domain-containing protein n=1 Tax=Oceanicoccus sp. KOV_DT_Chl TaxID=1904639 RepID=UPI000C7A14D2|nr:Ig-like domain-containing protein [Oceanicoccus sp. KOV_DT_Chl]